MHAIKIFAAAIIWLLASATALAQSTATPTNPGYLTTSGCPTGQTTCFKQYGTPVPTTNAATSTPLTPANISPSSNLTLTAGGASQTLAAANACPNFIYINNATSTAGEGGIAATESIWVNIQGGAATATGGGSSIEIAPGVIQPFVAQTTAITWIAATTGHKINAVCE